MDRRDFLFFRTGSNGQQAELSCEHLFMQFQDLCSAGERLSSASSELPEDEFWMEEPALVTAAMDIDGFFASVLDTLTGLESIQVVGLEWLAVGNFRNHVEKLLAAFRANGGEVRFPQRASKQSASGEQDYVPAGEPRQRIGA